MANYYNLCAYKRTGFNSLNRPLNREVLAQGWFVDPNNYVQMEGIAVKRDDSSGLTYIDLQGSVKDLRGDQVNPPNSTGTHGPKGPWYSWEEVDYIRMVRTGYPGDPDYFDISGNMADPWNAPASGKMYIDYYFVTGLQPMARDVTRLFLELDVWTTLGGADNLVIDSGFKTDGPVTDAEDAASFNLSPINIGLTEPLQVISYADIAPPGGAGANDVVVSAINLLQYTSEDTIAGIVAMAANGQSAVFPSVSTVSQESSVICEIPGLVGTVVMARDHGYYDYRDTQVQYNLSILYSTGQLELQDSYSVPMAYSQFFKQGGQFIQLKNLNSDTPSPVQHDIGAYPRKADYLFGQQVIFSQSSGSMDIENFYDLEDNSILQWAIVTAGGSPVARFKKIKGHAYIYDKSVTGMTWLKKAVIMQGASGSMWNQIDHAFAMQANKLAGAENEAKNQIQTERFIAEGTKLALDTGIGLARAGSSGVSIQNYLSGGKETWDAAQNIANTAYSAANLAIDAQADYYNRVFAAESLKQDKNRINHTLFRQNFSAPYTQFIPDLNTAVFQSNTFSTYIVNTGPNDRERLRNYFKRYGYGGQYKKLTWDVINVKQKVNYIRAEGVSISHPAYPQRVTARCASLLQDGLFLWNQKPEASAFDDNPDN